MYGPIYYLVKSDIISFVCRPILVFLSAGPIHNDRQTKHTKQIFAVSLDIRYSRSLMVDLLSNGWFFHASDVSWVDCVWTHG